MSGPEEKHEWESDWGKIMGPKVTDLMDQAELYASNIRNDMIAYQAEREEISEEKKKVRDTAKLVLEKRNKMDEIYAGIDAKRAELDAYQKGLEQRKAELDKASAELEDYKKRLEEERAGLEEDRSKYEEAGKLAAEAEETKKALSKRKSYLDKRESTLGEKEKELLDKEKEFLEKAKELVDKEGEIKKGYADLEEREGKIDKAYLKKVEGKEAKLKAKEEQLKDRERILGKKEKLMKKEYDDFEKLRKEFGETEGGKAAMSYAQAEQLRAEAQKMSAEAQKLCGDIKAERRKLVEQEEALEEKEIELMEREEILEKRKAEHPPLERVSAFMQEMDYDREQKDYAIKFFIKKYPAAIAKYLENNPEDKKRLEKELAILKKPEETAEPEEPEPKVFKKIKKSVKVKKPVKPKKKEEEQEEKVDILEELLGAGKKFESAYADIEGRVKAAKEKGLDTTAAEKGLVIAREYAAKKKLYQAASEQLEEVEKELKGAEEEGLYSETIRLEEHEVNPLKGRLRGTPFEEKKHYDFKKTGPGMVSLISKDKGLTARVEDERKEMREEREKKKRAQKEAERAKKVATARKDKSKTAVLMPTKGYQEWSKKPGFTDLPYRKEGDSYYVYMSEEEIVKFDMPLKGRPPKKPAKKPTKAAPKPKKSAAPVLMDTITMDMETYESVLKKDPRAEKYKAFKVGEDLVDVDIPANERQALLKRWGLEFEEPAEPKPKKPAKKRPKKVPRKRSRKRKRK